MRLSISRIVRLGFDSGPTLISALIFAIALLVAPWFVTQPALGLGFMAARTPRPVVTRAINVSVHTIFGIGVVSAPSSGRSAQHESSALSLRFCRDRGYFGLWQWLIPAAGSHCLLCKNKHLCAHGDPLISISGTL